MAKSKTFLSVPVQRVHTEPWILGKALKFAKQYSRPGKSLVKIVKSLDYFFISKQQQVRKSEFFPLVKSHSVLPIAKTFNHKMRSFRTLLFPHCTVVTVPYGASWKKLGFSEIPDSLSWILYSKAKDSRISRNANNLPVDDLSASLSSERIVLTELFQCDIVPRASFVVCRFTWV